MPSGCSGSPSGEADKFNFCFRNCQSAVVEGMDPQEGDASQPITITGSGFSTNKCQNKVVMGDNECEVTTASSTEIVCSIDTDCFPVGTYQKLSVTVNNYGKASSSEMKNLGFTAHPVVHSVNPSKGSLHGGTLLTIIGSGLCNKCTNNRRKRDTDSLVTDHAENAVIYIGNEPCIIQSINFEEITCKTESVLGNMAEDLAIAINSDGEKYDASCSSDCKYAFSSDATPSINAPTTIVDQANQILTIEGALLESTTSVSLGSTACQITTPSATSVQCNAGTPVAGVQQLKVITGDGAANTESITVQGSVSSLTPTTGSTEGKTKLTITGFGFDPSDFGTVVEIDGASCDIIEVTNTQIICRTPAHAEGDTTVVVTANSEKFDEETFTYSADATPSASSVTPTIGLSGTNIDIAGKYCVRF